MPGITRGTSPHQSEMTWTDPRPLWELVHEGRVIGSYRSRLGPALVHVRTLRSIGHMPPGELVLRCGKETVEV